MSQEKWTAVDDYFDALFTASDPILEAALQDSDTAGLRQINVAPNQGKLLMLLAMSHGARNILEIGTLGGYSTIWLGRALPEDGHIITLELDPTSAEVARANIARAQLSEQIDVRVGPALETLPQIAATGEGPFDLIFIDADKPNNPHYLEWALKLSRKGTLIIGDNVVRDGAVIESDSDDPNVQGIRKFNAMLATDPRLTATAVQTVGSKGYDGFALAIVTSD